MKTVDELLQEMRVAMIREGCVKVIVEFEDGCPPAMLDARAKFTKVTESPMTFDRLDYTSEPE